MNQQTFEQAMRSYRRNGAAVVAAGTSAAEWALSFGYDHAGVAMPGSGLPGAELTDAQTAEAERVTHDVHSEVLGKPLGRTELFGIRLGESVRDIALNIAINA